MFEHKSERLLPRRAFLRRQAKHLAVAGVFVALGWCVGILGYVAFEGMSLLDATLNAAMILGGMGPVGELHTTAGKLFASFYAIFSGVGFIGVSGILFAPVYHRFIHKFHIELREESMRKHAQAK